MLPLIFAAASAILPSVISGIGQAAAAGNRDEAERLRQQAMKEYGIELPPVEEIHQQALKADPRLRGTEMDALSELQDMYKSGGLRLTDRARLNEVSGEASARERGAREALTQQYASRGMGGSGMAYAQMLASQQSGADRERQAGLTIAGNAQDAQLQAIREAAGLAGNVRGQDLALDQYNREANFRENAFNVGQRQQHFQNAVSLADRKARELNNQADAEQGRAQQTAQTWGGVGQGVGQGAGAFGQWALMRGWGGG